MRVQIIMGRDSGRIIVVLMDVVASDFLEFSRSERKKRNSCSNSTIKTNKWSKKNNKRESKLKITYDVPSRMSNSLKLV